MIRKTLTTLSLLGLLLSLGLWCRSQWVMDSLMIPLSSGGSYVGLSSGIGVISIGQHVDSELSLDGIQLVSSDARQYQQQIREANQFFAEAARKNGRPKPKPMQPIKTFGWRNSSVVSRGRTIGSTALSFPHCVLALVFTVPLWKPLWGIYRRQRRRQRGLCLGCAYNLRGLTEYRCPECGKEFAPRATHPYKVSSTASSVSIIVAWHVIVFPATLVFVDWLLGYGATVNGVPVPPRAFDIHRVFSHTLHPFFMLICAAILFVEGGLAWLVFRLRRGPNFRLFLSSWRRICLWGILGLPLLSVVFALISQNYDAGMNFPLLWVSYMQDIGAGLSFQDERRRYTSSLSGKHGLSIQDDECRYEVSASGPKKQMTHQTKDSNH